MCLGGGMGAAGLFEIVHYRKRGVISENSNHRNVRHRTSDIQGGMHYVGFAELAAGGVECGGLGIITGLTRKTPELLAKEIRPLPHMTDKPFGVNLNFLPSLRRRPIRNTIAAIREGGVKGRWKPPAAAPSNTMPALKAAGIKVIHKCTSCGISLKAEKIGCDAVSVDGSNAAGHPGETTFRT